MGALRVAGFNILLLLAGCVLLELALRDWLVDRRVRNLNRVSNRLLVHDPSHHYDYVHSTLSGARKIGDYLDESLRDAIRP